MAGRRLYSITFTAFLMIVLLVMASGSARAQFKDKPADFITVLTEQNIKDFLRESGEITTGQRPEMMDEDIANYFTNHMSERARLRSRMSYEIPNFPTQESDMELGRNEYINTVINGRYMMENYTANIEIRDLNITGNGKQANFTSIVTEKGNMPFPSDPEKPNDLEMIPIEGISECEQKLVVSYNNFIQMLTADCKTSISFDPFAGKPLAPP